MTKGELQITRRHLPHWSLDGAPYFVTSRVVGGKLSVDEQKMILEHIRDGHGKFYTLIACVVMPDHIHILFMADMNHTLSAIMKGIKGVTARKINERRKTHGSLWQEESFDRIVRNEKELYGKLQYMQNNPAEAGLTHGPQRYHGWYYNEEFFK